jgi:NIPSNAP
MFLNHYIKQIINTLTMKKNVFYRIIPAFLLFSSIVLNSFGAGPVRQQYYEIKIYKIADKSQEAKVDAFLKDAYLPALHRAGIPVIGVFKPIETDTASFGKLVYVFIPFKTVDQFIQLAGVLNKDKVFADAGKSFIDAPYNDPPFIRYETIFLKAFSDMPQFAVPKFSTPASERIYELRSYESATDAKAVKKIEMFNKGGEISLFKKLEFQPVFYAEVLSGSHMPNLMYMTTFSDMKSHDEHWSAFGKTEEWKKLSGMDEYKNTVSKANPYLLHPTSYSDF